MQVFYPLSIYIYIDVNIIYIQNIQNIYILNIFQPVHRFRQNLVSRRKIEK